MTHTEVILGDITKLKVDAIVNAANSGLAGGGGVDGAIHRAAGKELYDECMRFPDSPMGRCPAGECVITGAGRLHCKNVIHTVGPIYSGKPSDALLLSNCYRNCLITATKSGLKSIAFSCISTGVYGYPKLEAARIAVDTVQEVIPRVPIINSVFFVCFDDENYTIYKKLLPPPV
ncbi:MAG: O-acetyl-ADP-ribose deacetylase [Spirochaetaceae bacterium]|jgi:O-acetyl-ADP-ribose deacetylase (regulator of RNase III)|nr:O-acetyl-ADP-ribose deacetylase [Spirochaetaceae bacterium]